VGIASTGVSGDDVNDAMEITQDEQQREGNDGGPGDIESVGGGDDEVDDAWEIPLEERPRQGRDGPGDIAQAGVLDDGAAANNGCDQVHICHCQVIPSAIPQHYTPPCLPRGAMLATREIQMFSVFRANLLGTEGEPPKTQTLRVWGAQRKKAHYTSYTHGRWIRVWRGQGHKDTIGWMLITHWDTVHVGDITQSDCVREGRPNWQPDALKRTFFRGLTSNTPLTRVQFVFRKCLTIIA
jgi:hypothetical protein